MPHALVFVHFILLRLLFVVFRNFAGALVCANEAEEEAERLFCIVDDIKQSNFLM